MLLRNLKIESLFSSVNIRCLKWKNSTSESEKQILFPDINNDTYLSAINATMVKPNERFVKTFRQNRQSTEIATKEVAENGTDSKLIWNVSQQSNCSNQSAIFNQSF